MSDPPDANSRTMRNLAAAFAGKSMMRNRYNYFAAKAKKQGFEQIAAIFEETAENQLEHARIFLELMNGDGSLIHIRTNIQATKIGSTKANLECAANEEKNEAEVIYPKMIAVAEEEGYSEIAEIFTQILEIERNHEARFRSLIQKFETKSLFKRSTIVRWKCRNCGYIYEGKVAPNVCPACDHPQGFYQIQEVLE